jgi:hypothetical protein
MSLHPITDKLLDYCNGDSDAVKFIEDFWAFCIVWDDMIDQDKHYDDDHINNAMMWALFGINDDPFYRKFEIVLRPAIMQCIAKWMVANRFENSHDNLAQAYTLRCSPYDVFATVVLLATGSFQKQTDVVEYLYEFTVGDKLDDYIAEHEGK